MPAYTTFIINNQLLLSVTPPVQDEDTFKLQTALKPSLLPYSFFPPRSRSAIFAALADAAHGVNYRGEPVDTVTITEPSTAEKFVELLVRHHFLRPDDLIALRRTIGAWMEPEEEDPRFSSPDAAPAV